jgi:hypothetical protein
MMINFLDSQNISIESRGSCRQTSKIIARFWGNAHAMEQIP